MDQNRAVYFSGGTEPKRWYLGIGGWMSPASCSLILIVPLLQIKQRYTPVEEIRQNFQSNTMND